MIEDDVIYETIFRPEICDVIPYCFSYEIICNKYSILDSGVIITNANFEDSK